MGLLRLYLCRIHRCKNNILICSNLFADWKSIVNVLVSLLWGGQSMISKSVSFGYVLFSRPECLESNVSGWEDESRPTPDVRRRDDQSFCSSQHFACFKAMTSFIWAGWSFHYLLASILNMWEYWGFIFAAFTAAKTSDWFVPICLLTGASVDILVSQGWPINAL